MIKFVKKMLRNSNTDVRHNGGRGMIEKINNPQKDRVDSYAISVRNALR